MFSVFSTLSFFRFFAGALSSLNKKRWSSATKRKGSTSAGDSKNTKRSNPFVFRPPQNPDGEHGSKYWRVNFAEGAHWAAIKRMMRTELRWTRGRNTRGLPVGMSRHENAPADLRAALHRQERLRRNRPSKLARRIASSFGTKASPDFRIRYFVEAGLNSNS